MELMLGSEYIFVTLTEKYCIQNNICSGCQLLFGYFGLLNITHLMICIKMVAIIRLKVQPILVS